MLMVEFENEKRWTYTYSVRNGKSICQLSVSTPDRKMPWEGKHIEEKDCEMN